MAALLVGCTDNTESGRQPSPVPVAKAPHHPVITIDPTVDRGAVNRLVFGHNIEAANGKGIDAKEDTLAPRAGCGAWDVTNHAPIRDTVAWSKAIGMGMLRYPGGCLTHNFD